jgi:membrane-bound serine protease (ClpP class)
MASVIRRRRNGRLVIYAALAAAGLVLLVAGRGAAQEDARGIAYSVELTGTIDPATENWTDKALDEADERGARLAIIRLDTPGGLDTAMRAIVKDIIAARLPVVVYVSPDGARAASAGLFVTQAGDVAAMAPQTNIGSATPISIGPGEQDEVLGRKIRNDAAAYVRALAEGHGRDGDLAERMVRSAANVTAARAERAGLVDLVAGSERDLLERLDGFRVKGPKAQTLKTAGLELVHRDMPFQYDVQQLLVNPTVAFLLLLGGLAGIAAEVLAGGGAILPGALGAVALILGLYGTAQLPLNAAGILLLLLALGLLVAETQIPSYGALTAGGIAALIAGGLLLFDTDSEAFSVSLPAVAAAGALLGGFTLFALSKALAARRETVHGGSAELVGARGTVRVPLDPVGQVFVHGSLWRARPADPSETPEPGDRVTVEAVDGLTLTVRPEPSEPERKEGPS